MPTDQSEPPSPPQFERKVAFHRVELIGMILIALIPLLALLNVFGLAYEEVVAADQPLDLRVEYISRARVLQLSAFTIDVENTGDEALPLVTVSIDRDYIDSFTQVAFTPDVDRITDQAYQVELEDVQPGETRVISVDLRPAIAGQHTAAITAEAGGANTAVTFNSIIFP